VAVTFDLEQVLYSPKVNVISLFYKRKLSCYNLTIYNLATGDVSCYMWHEGIGGRGSDEMASCVYDYIQSLPECTEHVYLFSDTTCGVKTGTFKCLQLYSVHVRRWLTSRQLLNT